jgi:hypothetical protein
MLPYIDTRYLKVVRHNVKLSHGSHVKGFPLCKTGNLNKSCTLYRHTINSNQQSPSWKANSHSASQENSRTLRNPKAHYRFLKGLHLVPILSQMHSIHTFQQYFANIHCNILPSHLRLGLSSSSSFQILRPYRNMQTGRKEDKHPILHLR